MKRVAWAMLLALLIMPIAPASSLAAAPGGTWEKVWEGDPESGEEVKLFGIGYGGPAGYIAVGQLCDDDGCDAVILTSQTAAAGTWERRSLDRDLNWGQLRDVAYGIVDGVGTYVAVGGWGEGHGLIATSTDGVTWSVVEDDPGYLQRIAYGDGKFVAVGDWTIIQSQDGTNWIETWGDEPPEWVDFRIHDIAYGDQGFFFTAAISFFPIEGFPQLPFSLVVPLSDCCQPGFSWLLELPVIASNGPVYVLAGDLIAHFFAEDGTFTTGYRGNLPAELVDVLLGFDFFGGPPIGDPPEWVPEDPDDPQLPTSGVSFTDVAAGDGGGFMAIGTSDDGGSVFATTSTATPNSWQLGHLPGDVDFSEGAVTHGAAGFVATQSGESWDDDVVVPPAAIYLYKPPRPRPRLPVPVIIDPPPVAAGQCAADNAPETGPLTRAEFMLTLGLDPSDEPHLFTDVDGHPLEPCISSAAHDGIVVGYPGAVFRPDQPITLEEALTILLRWAEIEPGEPTGDERVSAWARTYWATALARGLIAAADDPQAEVDLALAQALREMLEGLDSGDN